MYCIFATITPKEQYFESAKAAILAIVERTRHEEGCIQFDVHTKAMAHDETDNDAATDVTNQPKQLYLYEQWHNESALALHYQQSYTQKVFAAYALWLAKPVEINAMHLS